MYYDKVGWIKESKVRIVSEQRSGNWEVLLKKKLSNW